MKEKILSIIHKKLSDGFHTQIFRPNEFENLCSEHYDSLLEELTSLTKMYYKLFNSESKNESSLVIKIYKEDFIIKSFNREHYVYNSKDKYTIEDLEKLKEKHQDLYDEYADEYDNEILREDEDYYSNSFVIPLLTYVESKAKEIISTLENIPDLSINKLFWNYFLKSFIAKENRIRKDELINTPENIFEKFKNYYLSMELIQLLSITDRQISDIEFSGLESCIVNIGERNFVTERSGWTTNNFKVMNNGNDYKYSISTKDESKIEGKFINIFILQLNKRHLLKISITINETEQTPYIIYRDFEKVSLKNEFEILIAKHHGNETIIFDTKREALEFQSKVLELKEGRASNFRKS